MPQQTTLQETFLPQYCKHLFFSNPHLTLKSNHSLPILGLRLRELKFYYTLQSCNCKFWSSQKYAVWHLCPATVSGKESDSELAAVKCTCIQASTCMRHSHSRQTCSWIMIHPNECSVNHPIRNSRVCTACFPPMLSKQCLLNSWKQMNQLRGSRKLYISLIWNIYNPSAVTFYVYSCYLMQMLPEGISLLFLSCPHSPQFRILPSLFFSLFMNTFSLFIFRYIMYQRSLNRLSKE